MLVASNGSNINPVALAIMNLTGANGAFIIPSPQIAGSGVNYTASVPSIFNEDQVADTIPEAELVILPNLGHVPHLEEPDVFYPPPLKFLK